MIRLSKGHVHFSETPFSICRAAQHLQISTRFVSGLYHKPSFYPQDSKTMMTPFLLTCDLLRLLIHRSKRNRLALWKYQIKQGSTLWRLIIWDPFVEGVFLICQHGFSSWLLNFHLIIYIQDMQRTSFHNFHLFNVMIYHGNIKEQQSIYQLYIKYYLSHNIGLD